MNTDQTRIDLAVLICGSKNMSRRTEMLGSTIQRELMEIIMRDLSDPRLGGLPSITRVKVSADLSIADVYVTIMGSEGHQQAALNALRHSAGIMRTKLTKVLSLSNTSGLTMISRKNGSVIPSIAARRK